MSAHSNGKKNKFVYLLQEFSVPLLLGVVAALVLANVDAKLYDKLVYGTYSVFTGETYEGHVAESHGTEDQGVVQHGTETREEESHEVDSSSHGGEHVHTDAVQSHDSGAGGHGWRHYATMHFLINEIFMVFFFGVAAKEITESCLPGGALNPPSKAVNPLLGTIGGVLGPVGVYFLLNALMGEKIWETGWGIPTATDIALAWLVARLVFGTGHPAISFLLLLAVADDGIGLGIIAIFYPSQEPVWLNTIWVLPAMAIAFGLRKMKVQAWLPYIVVGGGLSWWGLYSAHLHPALALVPIVPFLPGPVRDEGLFRDDVATVETDPLNNFEHSIKSFVDFGLFFFAFSNAGVPFSNVNNLTMIVFLSLLVGKTLGIFLFSYAGAKAGFPLPDGMKMKHLFVAAIIAGLGLTVALFVAGQAFTGETQGAAKMGALFSGGVAFIALLAGRMLSVKDGAGRDPKPRS